MSEHSYRVEDSPARVEREGGVRVDLTADQMPLLDGMALATLSLEPGAAREPHWHPNAAELSCCLEGSLSMTVVEPGGNRVTMAVEEGDVVFVPPGYIHDIQNSAGSAARFAIVFSHERYQDLNLSSSLSQMPKAALDATFGSAAAFDWVEPVDGPVFISRPENPAEPPAQGASPYRYEVEKLEPQVSNDGGSLIFARGDDFPILSGLAMYSLRMGPRAVREPHWHPNAAELNYVIEGRVRLTIVSPGGGVESVEIGPGEVSYIPRAFFHHIETVGDDPARLAVFFDHEMPEDNGISAALSGYSADVLASVFGRPAKDFESLPDFERDVLLSPPLK